MESAQSSSCRVVRARVASDRFVQGDARLETRIDGVHEGVERSGVAPACGDQDRARSARTAVNRDSPLVPAGPSPIPISSRARSYPRPGVASGRRGHAERLAAVAGQLATLGESSGDSAPNAKTFAAVLAFGANKRNGSATVCGLSPNSVEDVENRNTTTCDVWFVLEIGWSVAKALRLWGQGRTIRLPGPNIMYSA